MVRFNFDSSVKQTEDKLVPRCSPGYFLHISPHRILDFERSALGFGPTGEPNEYRKKRKSETGQVETRTKNETGVLQEETEDTGLASEDKDSVEPDGIESNDPVFQTRVSEMTNRGIYKSTAQEAAKEFALPVLARPVVLPRILGKNEDRELYHSVYQRTGTWKAKTVPTHWERQQERQINVEPKKDFSCALRSSPSKLLRRRSQKTREEFFTAKVEKLKNAKEVGTPANVHVRPVPHYGGFVPRLPVIPSRTGDPRLNLTSSAATYRCFPAVELKFPEFAHQGPLSKLVTTTSPCNPFKKMYNLS